MSAISVPRHRSRWFVAPLLVALPLAACGDDDPSTATNDSAATAPTPTTAPTATTAAPPAASDGRESTIPTTVPATSAPTSAPGGPRTVEHAAGTTEIPADVERVVALDQAAALDALALGIEPVVAFAGFGPQPPLDEIIASYTDVDVEPYAVLTPNVETVAAARPDLILASGHPTTIATYDAYSALAPTVIIPYDTDWRDQLTVAADALGRDTRSAEVADTIDAAVTSLGDTVTANGLTGSTVSLLAARGGSPYAFPTTELPGQLLTDIGIDRPAAQQAPVAGPVPLIPFAIETLADHDANVLILIDSAATDTEDVIVASPLYAALNAVATGHVATVNADMWLGASPFSALWISQDLTAILVNPHQSPDDLGTAVDRWQAIAP